MFALRIGFLSLLLTLIAAYPMEVQMKSNEKVSRIEPADYPDLTHGLSDAEVESTLNGLSLDDLNALNKLLDDAGNGPFDLEASLRGHHRQVKKQHYEELDANDDDLDAAISAGKQSLDDGCHDEEDADKDKDRCTERSKCNKRPTTRRCSTTKKCTTPCKSMESFIDINMDAKYGGNNKNNKNAMEECDPEDTICLQRCQQRSKQRTNMQEFSDLQKNNIDSLERLAAQAHRDDKLKFQTQLNDWNSKDDTSREMFNVDYDKLSDAEAAENMNDFGEMQKLGNSWAQDNVAEDEGQPQQNEEEPKPFDADVSYSRSQLARVAQDRQMQEEEKAYDYKRSDDMDGTAIDEHFNAAPAAAQDRASDELDAAEPLPFANDMAASDGDSFIAGNAREPPRYHIQTDDGFIESENGRGDNQLRADKQQSEMLNYETLQSSNQRNLAQNRLEYKRIKRDNRRTDDAPENNNESYLKKLMDSFPRDQGSQSNLNMAIRQAKLAHLRVKRS